MLEKFIMISYYGGGERWGHYKYWLNASLSVVFILVWGFEFRFSAIFSVISVPWDALLKKFKGFGIIFHVSSHVDEHFIRELCDFLF